MLGYSQLLSLCIHHILADLPPSMFDTEIPDGSHSDGRIKNQFDYLDNLDLGHYSLEDFPRVDERTDINYCPTTLGSITQFNHDMNNFDDDGISRVRLNPPNIPKLNFAPRSVSECNREGGSKRKVDFPFENNEQTFSYVMGYQQMVHPPKKQRKLQTIEYSPIHGSSGLADQLDDKYIYGTGIDPLEQTTGKDIQGTQRLTDLGDNVGMILDHFKGLEDLIPIESYWDSLTCRGESTSGSSFDNHSSVSLASVMNRNPEKVECSGVKHASEYHTHISPKINSCTDSGSSDYFGMDGIPKLKKNRTENLNETSLDVVDTESKRSMMPEFRERLASLKFEGDLVVGTHEGLASEINLFLYKTMHNILVTDSSKVQQKELMDSIPERLSRVGCHFFRLFFGGVRVLSYQFDIFDEREIITQAWRFLQEQLKSWHWVSIKYHIENLLRQEKPERQNLRWKSPQDLLVYLIHVKKNGRFGETHLYILLDRFIEYWNSSEKHIQSLYFSKESFQVFCREMERRRKIHDSWMDLNSSAKDPTERTKKAPKGRIKIIDRTNNYLVKRKQKRVKTGFDMETWNKGVSLIANHESLTAKITTYFSELRIELCMLYSESGYSIPPKHPEVVRSSELTRPSLIIQKGVPCRDSSNPLDDVKASRLHNKKTPKFKRNTSCTIETRVEQAVRSVKDRVIPAFLGMVMVLHEKKGDIFSLEYLIEHAWEFLKTTFSMWKTQHFRWAMQAHKSLPKAMFSKKFVDWSNSQEAFDFYLVYGRKNSTHVGHVWYLARQWLALIVRDVRKLKPNVKLDD